MTYNVFSGTLNPTHLLGQVHIVLDGDPASPPQKSTAPIFGPCLLWPNGWMDQDATWYGYRRWPKPHCVRWGPRCPQRFTAPNFRPISIVTKRSPISAIAEHLSKSYFRLQIGAGTHIRTFADDWKLTFYRPRGLPVIQPTVSKRLT